MKIIWSPRSTEDLNRTVDRISRDKPAVALQWARKVRRKVLRIGRFPRSGRVVPEFGRDEVREILIGNYRVIYKIGETISVLTIFHGAEQSIEI